jgi:hypothetical protein
MNDRNRSRLRRTLLLYVAPPILLVVAIVLVVFLYIQFHAPVELDVTSQGFARNTVEITEGETIHFVNRSDAVQVLCLGADKTCDTSALAPKLLKEPGLRLAPGANVSVLFELYGTYNVTILTTSTADNLTITVDAGG